MSVLPKVQQDGDKGVLETRTCGPRTKTLSRT